jgi:threonine dehydrogenase-like Zn-dependent dehydrogenase
MSAMKALVYLGPAKKALEERPQPEITAPTDTIVKIAKTTICGTDLHILKMVATPEVKQRLETLGFAPVANTPAEFGERIKVEIARWGKVVRDANIKAD